MQVIPDARRAGSSGTATPCLGANWALMLVMPREPRLAGEGVREEDASRAGMASATASTTRECASVFGIALLGAIVTSQFKAARASMLTPGNRPGDVSPP